MSSKRVLVVSAHADDAEFWAGGTLAKLVDEGHEVFEIVTTNNERGSFELDSVTLVRQSREREAAEAARIIGKSEVVFLGYPDGFLSDTPATVLREQYIRQIRRLRPDSLFTFDPWAPFEPHPDHRQVAFAAVEAVSFAHMPLFHPEHKQEGLSPHLVPHRYFFAKHPERCNKVLDISGRLARKIDALCAQESQMKLFVDELRMDLELTGEHPGLLALLDRDNYRPAIEMLITAWAEQVGKPAGFEHGEQFRYERVGDILGEQAP